MADRIPICIDSLGRMFKAQDSDTLVGEAGGALVASPIFFYAKAATGNVPLQWDSGVINNTGFVLTVSNSLIEVPSAGTYLILAKVTPATGAAGNADLRVNAVVKDTCLSNPGAGGNDRYHLLHVEVITTPASQKIDINVSNTIGTSSIYHSLYIVKIK